MGGIGSGRKKIGDNSRKYAGETPEQKKDRMRTYHREYMRKRKAEAKEIILGNLTPEQVAEIILREQIKKANAEKRMQETSRKYYEANREKILAYNREYARTHKKKRYRAEYHSEYYLRVTKPKRERAKDWQDNAKRL